MSALDGFLSTWSQARTTFGEGTPQSGSTFDESSQLRQLQTQTQSAEPGEHWSGTASQAYGAKNAAQAQTLGTLADLDGRMAAELDQSAAVVSHGRRDLDDVKQWVVSAASAVPKSVIGEQMLLPVVHKGIGDVAAIVTSSNGELAEISERLRGLTDEYTALAGDDKPANEGELLSVHDQGDNQALPPTVVDLDDIVYTDPDALGPFGYKELVPDSGTWIPIPGGPVAPTQPPTHPLDLDDIVRVAPGQLAPSGYMELIPGSGAYVPNPEAPNYSPTPPTNPLDSTEILELPAGELPPYGYQELYPGAGVYVPG